MAACPHCGRPVAVARTTCLYCGHALPQAAVDAAVSSRDGALQAVGVQLPAAAADTPSAARSLVVLDVGAATAEALAAALHLSPFEARQRILRGGVQLHRIAPSAEAAAEAARIHQAGLAAQVIAETDVRAQLPPDVAFGARWREGRLRIRLEERECEVANTLLVVVGPITREYQQQAAAGREARRVRTATLEQGWRAHLHLRDAPRAIEVDPATLDFEGEGVGGGSSLLAVKAWITRLAPAAGVDDGFRRLPPVLEPAETPPGPGGALQAGRAKDAPAILDNAAQFRFYSAWRGLFARQRA